MSSPPGTGCRATILEPISPARLPVRSKSRGRQARRRWHRAAASLRRATAGTPRRPAAARGLRPRDAAATTSASWPAKILDRAELAARRCSSPRSSRSENGERTISAEGCRWMRMSPSSLSASSAAKASAPAAWRLPHGRRGCAPPRAAPRRPDREARRAGSNAAMKSANSSPYCASSGERGGCCYHELPRHRLRRIRRRPAFRSRDSAAPAPWRGWP